MRRLAAILLSAVCIDVALGETLDASLIQTDGVPSVGSGKFYGYRSASEGPGDDAFTIAYDTALAEGVPLVVIWSNDGCEHCDAFATELNANKAAVSAWLKSQDAVFAFFKDYSYGYNSRGEWIGIKPSPGHEPKACYDAWAFAYETCGARPSWPLFAFYHKGDTVIKWGSLSDSTGSKRTWANFTSNFEGWVKYYDIKRNPYRGGAFAASGGEFDRYEAAPSTEYIDVELVRDADKAGYAYSGRLEAVWPGESVARTTNIVEWAVSEASKTIRVSLQRKGGEKFEEGEISLKLLDSGGNVKHGKVWHSGGRVRRGNAMEK